MDYEPAIETFQKALTEHRNPDTLKKLNEAEKAKKELEQQEYFDPQIADEEREKGTLSTPNTPLGCVCVCVCVCVCSFCCPNVDIKYLQYSYCRESVF